MNEDIKTIYIKSYIAKADGIWLSSIILWSSLVSFAAPAFLMHWSIELYMKAFLFNHGRRVKEISTHNLEVLYDYVKNIDKNIDRIDIIREIKLINNFGDPYGGIRYIDKSKSSYYMLGPNTCEKLEELIKYIKENIEMDKDITDLTI